MLCFQKRLSQSRLLPETASEVGILDLEAVVDSDRLTALRTRRRGLQRQRAEEADIVPTEGTGEEGWDEGY